MSLDTILLISPMLTFVLIILSVLLSKEYRTEKEKK